MFSGGGVIDNVRTAKVNLTGIHFQRSGHETIMPHVALCEVKTIPFAQKRILPEHQRVK